MFSNIICFIIGAITSLILYACFLVGKATDEAVNIEEMEKHNE